MNNLKADHKLWSAFFAYQQGTGIEFTRSDANEMRLESVLKPVAAQIEN